MKLDHISFRFEESLEEIQKKPTNSMEYIMADIVKYTIERLQEAYNDSSTGVAKLGPKAIITILATNIIVNVVHASLDLENTTPSSRIKSVKTLMEDISRMVNDSYLMIESEKVNDESIN